MVQVFQTADGRWSYMPSEALTALPQFRRFPGEFASASEAVGAAIRAGERAIQVEAA